MLFSSLLSLIIFLKIRCTHVLCCFFLKFNSKILSFIFPTLKDSRRCSSIPHSALISAPPAVNLYRLSVIQHLHLDSQVSGNAPLPSNPAEFLNFLGAEIPGWVLTPSHDFGSVCTLLFQLWGELSSKSFSRLWPKNSAASAGKSQTWALLGPDSQRDWDTLYGLDLEKIIIQQQLLEGYHRSLNLKKNNKIKKVKN